MSSFNQPISGNDLARFSGPNTFMRLPQASALEGLDVAVGGMSVDIGTSWGSGTRFGDEQMRAQSAMIRADKVANGAAAIDRLAS
ncbi:MAG: agmatinase, partial [Ruegeria sp.]